MIVAAKTDVGSVAIADLDGLVFSDRKRHRPSNARTCLPSCSIGDTVYCGGAAEPEISVQRSPATLFGEVIAQVPLEGAYRIFRLRFWVGDCEESTVRRVEPHPYVGIEQSITPTLRIAQFWFEGPAVRTEIYKFRRVVLARLRH